MRNVLLCSFFLLLLSVTTSAKPIHHYVFFNMNREKLKDAAAIPARCFQGLHF